MKIRVVRPYNPIKKIILESIDEVSYGYRAGDIEGRPPETLGNFRGGRGTGHFGTGYYFFGSEDQAKGYAKPMGVRAGGQEDTGEDDREVNKVDFDNYHLLRVNNNIDGLKLHDALKDFQSTHIKAFVNNKNGIALSKAFETEKEGNFGVMYSTVDE